MPPMVEAKMIARIIQQIMIMIFFCTSGQGKKEHVRSHVTVQSCKGGKTSGSGHGGGCEGQGRWIWLLEPRMLIGALLSGKRVKIRSTAISEDV